MISTVARTLAASLLVLAGATAVAGQDGYRYTDAQGRTAYFADGVGSFADVAPELSLGSPAPKDAAASDRRRATGAPDGKSLTLGCGGSVVLRFQDNALIDVPGPDLYIFEIGPDIEATSVEISVDSASWIAVGRVTGSTSALDIARQAQTGVSYYFVRLTDLKGGCGSETYPGADIDAVGAIGSIAVGPSQTACVELHKRRAELERKLGEVMDQKLPEEQLREIIIVLEQIQIVVKGTADDAEKDTRLAKLENELRKYDGPSANVVKRVADGVKDWTGKLADAIAPLEAIIPVLKEVAELLEREQTNSAKDRVLELKRVFDEIRKRLPIDEVPGLGQLLDAYSESIALTAESVGRIEDRTKEIDAIALSVDELHKPIYLRTKSSRELRGEAGQAALQALAKLDQQLDDAGCNRRPEASGLCDPPLVRPDVAVREAENGFAPLRDGGDWLLQAVARAEQIQAGLDRTRDDLEFERGGLVERMVAYLGPKTSDDYKSWQRQVEALQPRIELASQRAATQLGRVQQIRAAYRATRRAWRDNMEAYLFRTDWNQHELLYLRFCKDNFQPPNR